MARAHCTSAPGPALARAYCTSARGAADGEECAGGLTHLDARGRARMVDVGDKPVTARTALAECSLLVGGRLLRTLRDANLPKGDALTVAQIAGVMAAKRTAELIPLCHALPLDCVRVSIELPRGECAGGGALVVRCAASCAARTGAEMEALTGAAVAALALYDMCKAVDKNMRVTDLRVLHKAGGRSSWAAGTPAPAPAPRPPSPARAQPEESFAPTNLMHF